MTVRLLLSIRELTVPNQPATVVRDGDLTLLTCDPRANRQDTLLRTLDLLDDDEQAQMWAAYGLTFPLPAWTSRPDPVCLYVPPALRLHGAPAIQGGVHAERRRLIRGGMVLEDAAIRAERRRETVDLQAADDLRRRLLAA